LSRIYKKLVREVSSESLEKRFNTILSKAGRLIDRFLRYREKGLTGTICLCHSPAPRGWRWHPAPGAFADRTCGGCGRQFQLCEPPAPLTSVSGPPQERSTYRSGYDPSESAICINREHAGIPPLTKEDAGACGICFPSGLKRGLLRNLALTRKKSLTNWSESMAEARTAVEIDGPRRNCDAADD